MLSAIFQCFLHTLLEIVAENNVMKVVILINGMLLRWEDCQALTFV